MKMNFVKTKGLSVWAALLLCATAYAGELPFPLLKDVLAAAKEVTAERYPDADYVVIDNLIAAKYNADGTDTSVDDEYVIALTESGRRHLSTASVWYSASYGSARIECAEIVKKDGRVVPVDVAANSRETIDTGQMGSNIYDRNSKYICQFHSVFVSKLIRCGCCALYPYLVLSELRYSMFLLWNSSTPMMGYS